MTIAATKPGIHNSLADVKGIRVAHGQDNQIKTGTTIILPEEPCVMGVDVRGGGPGTRETPALDPTCLVDRFHGLALSGGSVFGLAAGDGVVQALSKAGKGLAIGPVPLPVVPGAILFDLLNGGNKNWDTPPYAAFGRSLTTALITDPARNDASQIGAIGAGAGASAGQYQGGVGTASFVHHTGLVVAALICVNSFGNPTARAGHDEAALGVIDTPKAGLLAGNTTIGAIATNATLDKAGATRVAIMAQDGLARAIRPLHTPYDGDTLFTLATGDYSSDLPVPAVQTLVGSMAADAAEAAVIRVMQKTMGKP